MFYKFAMLIERKSIYKPLKKNTMNYEELLMDWVRNMDTNSQKELCEQFGLIEDPVRNIEPLRPDIVVGLKVRYTDECKKRLPRANDINEVFEVSERAGDFVTLDTGKTLNIYWVEIVE